jgi:hypothetical protein
MLKNQEAFSGLLLRNCDYSFIKKDLSGEKYD